MKIGIVGPVSIESIKDCLYSDQINEYTPKGLGGTPINTLIRELTHSKKYKVIVFTLDFSVEKEVILKGENLKICIGPYRKKGKARDFFKVERDYLISAIEKERPSILHAHWTYEFSLAALKTNIPVIVTAHDAPLRVLYYFKDSYRLIKAMMSFRVVRKAKYLTAVSDYISDHYKNYFFYKKAITVVPNGLSDDIFTLKKVKKNKDCFVFATVLNGWSNLKNPQVVLRAFNSLRLKNESIRLVMIGENYETSGIAHNWAASNGLDTGVEFLGKLTHSNVIKKLNEEIDVLIHPSLEESFSMIIAESMALKIPVIGGRYSGAVPSTLDYGKAGTLIDITSVKELEHAMKALLNNDKLRYKISEYGYHFSKSKFHIRNVVKQYEEIYQKINRI